MATFHCQKCKAPLKVDGSLEDLNPASFKILADAAPTLKPKPSEEPRSAAARQRKQLYDEVSRNAGSSMHKRNVSGGQRTAPKANLDMSYEVLSRSQVPSEVLVEPHQTPTKSRGIPKKKQPEPSEATESEGAFSQQMETTKRLFEILSARSDIDHPICSECTDLLLDGLQKRQYAAIKERDAYVDFLKKAQDDVPTEEEKAKTTAELEATRQREKDALEELEALEAEKAKMEEEIAALEAEAEELDEEEERFWSDRNAFTAELTSFQQERDSLLNQLSHDTEVLEALQRTNVYNDTFVIGHDGMFGTINGLRLGRLPNHPVEWAEINAAWGQVVLLLAVIAEKLGYKFKEYELVPVGSTSKIVKYDLKQPSGDGKQKGTILELFSSGNIQIGLNLFHLRIDEAMVSFLDCLRLVAAHVEQTSPGTKLPYVIQKDKIGDISIRLGNFGQEEQWTKACKFILTCCKFLLAHASHVDDTKSAR